MEAWINFGRGPLFRLAFSLMVLVLLRIFLLTLLNLQQAYRQNPDKIVPWKEIGRQTAGWLFPVARLSKRLTRRSSSVGLPCFVVETRTGLWLARYSATAR